MFTNFYTNNSKVNTGPGAILDKAYNSYKPKNSLTYQFPQAIDERMVNGQLETTYRDKTNPYDFGKSYAPPKTTYTSEPARTTVNQAQNALNSFKERTNSTPTFDPLANINQLDQKREVDEDGEEEPSILDRYLREVKAIQSGNFEYSATEKAGINNLNRTGRQMELRQSRVNDNYAGGTLQGELRSGRSRYAQEMADDAMISAMQTGVDAINEVDLQTQKSVVELENSIKEERLRQIAENYGLLQEQDKQRNDVAQQLQQNMLDYQKLQADLMNEERNLKYKYDNLAFQRENAGANRANSYAIAELSNSGGNFGGNSFFDGINVIPD